MLTATAQRFSKAFNRSFTLHIAQTPDSSTTRLFLGVLLSGETSEMILRDFKFIHDRGLHAFLEPLGLFLYRWGMEGSRIVSPDLLASRLEGEASLSSSSSDRRIGIKSELFRSFLEDPDSGAAIGPNIHSTIALTFLESASHAILKQWNPYEYVVSNSSCALLNLETEDLVSYTQVWTFSLERSNYFEDLVDALTQVTEQYISFAHLRSGLRRHHVKSVLVWIKACKLSSTHPFFRPSEWRSCMILFDLGVPSAIGRTNNKMEVTSSLEGYLESSGRCCRRCFPCRRFVRAGFDPAES
jgi:hypothetical protein